jgi:hypothetical protein
LKTGTTGVQFRKLANLAEDFQRFLLMVGEDLSTQGLSKESWYPVPQIIFGCWVILATSLLKKIVIDRKVICGTDC